MMLTDEVRTKFQGPFDEDRVWMSHFEGHNFDRDIDELKDVLSDHADRIEDTLDCVALLRTYERGTQLGPSVILVLVMSRTADRELFEASMGPIQHQIMDALFDYDDD